MTTIILWALAWYACGLVGLAWALIDDPGDKVTVRDALIYAGYAVLGPVLPGCIAIDLAVSVIKRFSFIIPMDRVIWTRKP